MIPSRYNFAVAAPDGVLLFNARTGSLLRLRGNVSHGLIGELTGKGTGDTDIEISRTALQNLVAGGFIIEDDFDEVARIRDNYLRMRTTAPAVLTVTATLDCNLGCFYCYEERSDAFLTLNDIPAVLAEANALLDQGAPSLHVDWYGGEPMLNFSFLTAASAELQQMCRVRGVKYSASVISNGTDWPKNIGQFISDHRVRQVQISFDGLREKHNKRRHFRNAENSGRSSFDEAVAVVSELLRHCRVDIRFNIDKSNVDDFIPFVHFVKEKGWFDDGVASTLQPAMVGDFSERAKFVDRIRLDTATFEQLKEYARGELPVGRVEEGEVPEGYAHPKASVCAALSTRSSVVGADKLRYRCGLQVSEPHRAVGSIQNGPFHILESKTAVEQRNWWSEFDPTTLPSCSRCSFLPLCLGGCPKRHLESDKAALDAQSVYWRNNLGKLISIAAGVQSDRCEPFSESDQFRD